MTLSQGDDASIMSLFPWAGSQRRKSCRWLDDAILHSLVVRFRLEALGINQVRTGHLFRRSANHFQRIINGVHGTDPFRTVFGYYEKDVEVRRSDARHLRRLAPRISHNNAVIQNGTASQKIAV
jgi:hypothetical protein